MIKFRAWIYKSSEMFDIKEIDFDHHSFTIESNDLYYMFFAEQDKTAIMESIGVKDITGKMIYEDDIVKIKRIPTYVAIPIDCICGIVKKDEYGIPKIVWKITGDDKKIRKRISNFPVKNTNDYNYEITVLGNTYENPSIKKELVFYNDNNYGNIEVESCKIHTTYSNERIPK